MKEVYIWKDRWFPVYSMSDEDTCGIGIKIPEIKKSWVRKGLDQFEEVQSYLHYLYTLHDSDPGFDTGLGGEKIKMKKEEKMELSKEDALRAARFRQRARLKEQYESRGCPDPNESEEAPNPPNPVRVGVPVKNRLKKKEEEK